MKKHLSIAMLAGVTLSVLSCKKSEVPPSHPNNTVKSVSFNIPEISLNFSVSYQEHEDDNFKVVLPGSYTLVQNSHLYNSEQHREYFILKCIRAGEENNAYIINGICGGVDADNDVAYTIINN